MPAPPGQLLRHGISDHQHRHGTAAVYISQKLIKPVEEFLQLRRLMRQPGEFIRHHQVLLPGKPLSPPCLYGVLEIVVCAAQGHAPG